MPSNWNCVFWNKPPVRFRGNATWPFYKIVPSRVEPSGFATICKDHLMLEHFFSLFVASFSDVDFRRSAHSIYSQDAKKESLSRSVFLQVLCLLWDTEQPIWLECVQNFMCHQVKTHTYYQYKSTFTIYAVHCQNSAYAYSLCADAYMLYFFLFLF